LSSLFQIEWSLVLLSLAVIPLFLVINRHSSASFPELIVLKVSAIFRCGEYFRQVEDIQTALLPSLPNLPGNNRL